MNKLGIFMNFWEKNWDADHKKYIKKVAEIGFDILEFQAQPLLEMSREHMRELVLLAEECGIELTYSLGLDRNYDVSSLDEKVRLGGVDYILVTDSEDDDAEALILKDVSAPEDEEAIYSIVDDDKEMDAVAAIFTDMLEDIELEKE